MSLHQSISLGIVASALIASNQLIASAQVNSTSFKTICEYFEVKTECNVQVDGKKIFVSGFQSAPIFTLVDKWFATDHRGHSFKVMRGGNYIFFNPQEGGTPLTIYNLNLK